ncbi:translocation and assembly module lipoprotein TamL [Aestuariibaculum suncheonense]|uniref:BamA/TamA family outer membrane protein n=1 Tax=Aestuariibaculum suncheonense TaxID=1028745 RepID=A0A8J6QXL1_9FLAO|nr:BamA/TamA family outer membrane protein [Aestuariibaculum suncheonense]MBD0836364.1 BamA/TamA family outer membrane protein [Aestuariibaculum suncheonense]
MKQHFLKISILTAIASHLFSCDAVKRVGENEHLLTNNTVIINGKKNSTETITNLLYQKPNSKIPVLGTPLRLQIYNLARPDIDSILNEKIYNNPKKLARKTKLLSRKQLDKDVNNRIGFNKWLKTTGEAPVIINEQRTEKSVKRLEDYHINNGWFDVEASYAINRKDNKRADVEYSVETGQPFMLDTITTKIKSPIVDSIYHKKILRNSLIKTNEQYKTSNFEQERDRISNELRNSGLYYFNQDYVAFEIDTIGTNKKVNVDIQIQDRAIRTQDSLYRVPFHVYKIKDVSIITDYTFEDRNKPFQDSITYDGFKLYSYGKMRYRPKALTDAIFIQPGSIFKDNDRTLTYRHINGLRTFKYPNIEYIENEDYTLTDTIRLTPLKKFSLGFSADVSQSNIQTIGFSLNPSLMMRNIFRGAETLEISAIGSIGSSKDQKVGDPFFDINEIGADLKLTIPRFFFPFNTNRIIAKDMSPSTKISLSTTSQTNIGLDKQTLSGVFNYNWSPSRKVTDRLDAFNIQYVRNLNAENYFNIYTSSFDNLENIALNSYNTPPEFIEEKKNGKEYLIVEKSDEFIDLVLSDNGYQNSNPNEYKQVNNINERKQRLTENNLILSSSFSLTNDERTNLFDEDFSIFRFKIETAGNLISAMSDILGLKKDDNNRYELFNVAYSQYVKTELDYVKHWDLGKKNILAARTFLGIAIPYGNSTNIPFSKSFFAGGANDNRAWTAYSLGPGSSRTSNDFNEANLKIALGLEQRFNIFEDLNGAFFIDAGNIWNVLDDVEDENAVFSSFNSLKDIAIGSGFGLRYDFSFFVFRFDIGFKTYDPSYQDQNRWFNDYNFSNAVYNIGINYPF